MVSRFDEILPRDELFTTKWELEIVRTGNPDLLSFGTADMDFRSPPEIVAALHAVVDRGHFGYPTRPPSYYEAIQAMLASHGWPVERSWIDSGLGIYPAMHNLIEELSEPGDDIVFQSPVHHIFADLIERNGRVPLENPLARDDDGRYRMDLEGLERVITPRTRLFLLCNPHNPVGRVWSRDELAALDEICRRRGVVVIADEVYYGLLHEGHTYVPFASVSRAASRNSVTLTGASKTFNLTGLKHSVTISENADLMAAYDRAQQRKAVGYGGSTMGIAAVEAAFRHGTPWTHELMTYIAGNRRILAQWLADVLPEIVFTPAEGTYFAWLDFRPLGLDDAQLHDLFERDAGLIIAPGAALGTGGSGHVRWNLACPAATLRAGLARLESAVAPRATAHRTTAHRAVAHRGGDRHR